MKHARNDYDRIQDPSGKIPEEEPVFLLRGQDKFAAKAVRAYARLVEAESPEIAKRAFEQADLMDKWPVKKIPDGPH